MAIKQILQIMVQTTMTLSNVIPVAVFPSFRAELG